MPSTTASMLTMSRKSLTASFAEAGLFSRRSSGLSTLAATWSAQNSSKLSWIPLQRSMSVACTRSGPRGSTSISHFKIDHQHTSRNPNHKASAGPLLSTIFSPPKSSSATSNSRRPFTSITWTASSRRPVLTATRQQVDVSRRTLYTPNSSQNLAHLEQTANNNPSSATAQNAFYSALLRANMPAIIVERFQTGRYASNSAAQGTYQKALEKLASGEVSTMDQIRQLSNGGNTVNRLQAVGQAVAAQSQGGSIASAKAGATGTGDKASPLYVVVEESTGNSILKWVKSILYFCLIAYVAVVMMTLGVELSGVLKRVGGANSIEAKPQQQKVRFSDVQGCDEAKEELQEIVEFLKNPQRFSALGGRLPKGVLLTGPPGTGKTLLARAVAGEAGVPFFVAAGSEFDEMYVGVGAKRIRELFNNARAKAPAIIFIDELDAIGSKRVDRDPAYVKQSLNQLLTELDGFTQDTGVIIIAATNLPQLLDKALTRPGRFDRNVVVPLPDVRGRFAILKHHMKKIQAANDVDEAMLARGTTGFSGADLENLINQAAVRASRNKHSKVSMSDLDWSKDKIMMGPERRSAVIQPKDKRLTAYHEAGHALVAIFTEESTPLYKVTIMPRGMALGLTHFLPDMDQVSMSKKQLLASMDVSMGGQAAEEIVCGADYVTTGCTSDLQAATKYARHMVTEAGMSALGSMDFATGYEKMSPGLKSQVEGEVKETIDRSRGRAQTLLQKHRKDLDLLANALLEYETLSRAEVDQVLRGEKISRSAPSPPYGGIKPPGVMLPLAGVSSGSASSSQISVPGIGGDEGTSGS